MKEDLKTKMQADFDSVTKKLDRAREKAQVANDRVAELEREQVALESALSILDGKGPVIPQYKPTWPEPSVTLEPRHLKVPTWTPTPALPDGAQYVEFNGERIILEPGFRVGKNSFNEDVLLPANMPDPEPMPEPVLSEGTRPPSLLPPLEGVSEGFSSEGPTEDIQF